MSERRVSGWFVLSAVFIVLVFGLFFTFTERKTWSEHRMELGPMDMRLVPPMSTLWCEAVALHSDHSFVAYLVNQSTQINPMRMNSQAVNLQMRLRGSWSTNSVKFKYFLLPSSVVGIVACASTPDVKLLIFKGDLNVQDCLQSLAYKDYSKNSDYDSEEDSSEEENASFIYETDQDRSSYDIMHSLKACSSLLHYRSVDTSNIDDSTLDCSPSTELHPIKVNISSADYYVIVAWNTNQHVSSHVNLQIMLDRTRYVVHTSGQTLDICSLSNSCTIGLNIFSGDRVLVSIPEEPNAGRSSFVVRSRCKPRLAIFAVLSVILPLLIFLGVAFVIRADRDSVGRFFCKTPQSNSRISNNQRIVAPLLDDQNAGSFESLPRTANRTEIASVQIEDMPPPYHSLYDPPPPYACVKNAGIVNAQANSS